MKRYILGLLLVMILIGVPIQGAEDQIRVTMNGISLMFDSEPFIHEERTMIPVRTVAEVLGADEIFWDEEQQRVIIVYEGVSYRLDIGSKTFLMGGIPREMDVAPLIADDRTMLPLRYMAEAFGFDVAWDEATQTVELTKLGVVVPEAYVLVSDYTEEDLLWLARIVNVEGLDIGYEAKLAIANVVLNRVKGDEYPDTVYDVIMDATYAVQFPPAHRSSFQSLEPDEQSWLVAEDALKGSNNIGECLYFNNRPFEWKADDLYKVIEGEYFYY